MKRVLSAVSILFLGSLCIYGQISVSGPGQPSLQTNPGPLNIPFAGTTEVLPLVKNGSFYMDDVNIVDCPDEKSEPFGLCSNQLFGGRALMSSHLQGYVQIRFYPVIGNKSHFEISFPQNLSGDDTVIAAPQMYQMPVKETFVFNPLSSLSSGDVDITTGEVSNQNVSVLVSNSWYLALSNVNPFLIPEPFSFPGPIGYSQVVFANRSDGLIDFTFAGSTFAPLGAAINGQTLRIPMPFCGPLANCASIQAQGTVLHPTMRLSTAPIVNPPCAPNCPSIPVNSDLDFTSNNYYTTLGDNFQLNVPQLGGIGPARSQLTGRVKMQFGVPSGNFVPFHLTALPPEGLLGPPLAGVPLGVSPGMIGTGEFLYFPNQTYYFDNVLTADDPFNNSPGELDMSTGVVLGNYILRSYFVQSIFIGLAKLNPGVVPASLAFQGPMQFEKGVQNETIMRFNGDVGVGFAGFVFPAADLLTGYITGPGSKLDLFYTMQMMHPVDPPTTVKAGSASNILSSLKDTFSYSYSIPCNPVGADASFTYTNNNISKKVTNGGTFTMNALSSVQCLNSRGSASKAGDYDTVTFSGYGSWSADSNPHVATVQVGTAPAYVHILIDAGQTSTANTKPVAQPFP